MFYYFMILSWFVFFQFNLAFDNLFWYRYITSLLLCKERGSFIQRRPPAMNIINIYTARRTEGLASINTDKNLLLLFCLSLLRFVKFLCVLYTRLPRARYVTPCGINDCTRMYFYFIYILSYIAYLLNSFVTCSLCGCKTHLRRYSTGLGDTTHI